MNSQFGNEIRLLSKEEKMPLRQLYVLLDLNTVHLLK